MIGKDFAGYAVREKLGEGGMGVVFLAEQHEPVRRPVALKLLRTTLASPAHRFRFQLEQSTLARLQHPHIARLYGAGTADDGTPYFAMEHVEGQTLVEFCDVHTMSLEDRIRIFLQVCRAVQYAHQRGVLHRDIKPSNVLVRFTDTGPHATLIDFGIAKVLDSEDGAGDDLTGNSVIGTPAYMAPEQLDRELDLDTRCDVYALSRVLELLVVGAVDGGRSSLVQRIRDLASNKTVSPAMLWSEQGPEAQTVLAKARGTTPSGIQRTLGGDLGAILEKGCAIERSDRYETAAALAEDLERYLAGYPILARSASRWQQLLKLINRHRLAATLVAILIVSLVSGAAVATIQAQRAMKEAERASAEARVAEETTNFLVNLFRTAEPAESRGEELDAKEFLRRGAQALDANVELEPRLRARMSRTIGVVYLELGLFEESERRLTEALALERAHSLPLADSLSDSLTELGILYSRQGKSEDAANLFSEAITIARTAYGEGSLELATARLSMAEHKEEVGDFDGVIEMLKHDLPTFRRHQASDPDAFFGASLLLAKALANQKRFEEAESVHAESLAVAKEIDNPTYLFEANTGLSFLYFHTGRVDEAADLAAALVGQAEKLYGPEHVHTGFALTNVGSIALRTGEAEDAISYMERALEIYRKRLGDRHYRVGRGLRDVALAHLSAGNPEEALKHALEGLDVVRALGGDGHVRTATVKMLVAEIEQALGRRQHATTLIEESLPPLQAAFGDASPQVTKARKLLTELKSP